MSYLKLSLLRKRTSIAGHRAQSGVLGTMLLLAAVLILLTLVALGLDSAHLISVRAQLRNAADAAALAGAEMLYSDPTQCQSTALAVAAMNTADGVPVKNSPGLMTVSETTQLPSGTFGGTVTVTARMTARDLITPIFNRFDDGISVTAVAGPAGSLRQTYQNTLFPIAISLDYTPQLKGGGGISLLNAALTNQLITLYLNAQHAKNAAFTTFTRQPADAHWIQSAIAQDLGISGNRYMSVVIPSVTVGSDNIYLNNGMDDAIALANEPFYSALLSDRAFLLPIVTGDPALNQSRLCVGFVAIKFKSINKNPQSGVVETLTGQIVDICAPGISGSLSSTGNSQWDTAIGSMTPKVVKLLQ